MALLNIQQLYFSIDETAIIDDFALQVNENEIVAILGESGSGKSTILRLIAGLEQPKSGTLLFDDERIIPPAEKLIAGHKAIKLVKQDYGLFPNVSLRENIAYELRFYNKEYQQERIDKLLQVSKLSTIANRLPRQVSGGEQQRTVIARALADEPRLLLLDEPFSHLDRGNKARLKSEILNAITSENGGCIFVTHDVADAYGIANKIVIIKSGKTLQTGTPTEIYHYPVNEYVAELTGDTNFLSREDFGKLTGGKTIIKGDRLLVRPEWIQPSPDGFSGVIKKKTFYGQFFNYEIMVNDLKIKWSDLREYDEGNVIELAIQKSVVINQL